jgi:hypothetical protein
MSGAVPVSTLNPILADWSANQASLQAAINANSGGSPGTTPVPAKYIFLSPTTFPLMSFEQAAGHTTDLLRIDWTVDNANQLIDWNKTYGPAAYDGNPNGFVFYSPFSCTILGNAQQIMGTGLQITAGPPESSGQYGNTYNDMFDTFVLCDATGVSPLYKNITKFTGYRGWGWKKSFTIGVYSMMSANHSDYPGAGTPGGSQWPADWSLCLESLIAAANAQNTGNCAANISHVEKDYTEVGAETAAGGIVYTAISSDLGYWTGGQSGTYPNCKWAGGQFLTTPGLGIENSPTGTNYLPPGFSLTKFWRHSQYLTAADNLRINGDSSGPRVNAYLNGVLTFSVTTAQFPQLGLLDSQTQRLMFGGFCGTTAPHIKLAHYVRAADSTGLVVYP